MFFSPSSGDPLFCLIWNDCVPMSPILGVGGSLQGHLVPPTGRRAGPGPGEPGPKKIPQKIKFHVWNHVWIPQVEFHTYHVWIPHVEFHTYTNAQKVFT